MSASNLFRLLALGLLLLTAGACKKSTDADAVGPSSCLLTGNGDLSFSYTSAGKLASIKYKDGSETFAYSSGKITTTTSLVGTGTFSLGNTCLLNAAGYIVKRTTTFNRSSVVWNALYAYDADGHLIRQDDYQGSYQLYDWTNGNQTRTRLYASNGKLYATSTYSYFENKQATSPARNDGTGTFGLPGDEALYMAGLFGKQTKNPVKQEVFVGINGGYTADYSYTYDSRGNITSVTATSGASQEGDSYTYKCQ